MTDATMRISPDVLAAQAHAILAGWGMGEAMARTTADVLVDCDLRGIDTHGISLLALYTKWMEKGGFDFAAEPVVETDGPSHASLDAKGGLGFAVSVQAMDLAVEKAREMGVAVVTVRNSHHFGAAGYYARHGARQGMVTLVATSTKVVCVAPPGAAQPVLGTNPLAYGVPRGDSEPIVFDMATSTAAGNKVRLHHLQGKPIPEGWVVDAEGRPVTDAAQANDIVFAGAGGGLTPLGATPVLGSHKGYGLALLVHFLGGTLAGGTLAGSSGGTPKPAGDNIGHFFLAIAPGVFRPLEDFLTDVDDVADTMTGAAPVDPERPVLLPGDIERRVHEERSRTGVPLAANLVDQLRRIAADLDVPFHLEPERTAR